MDPFQATTCLIDSSIDAIAGLGRTDWCACDIKLGIPIYRSYTYGRDARANEMLIIGKEAVGLCANNTFFVAGQEEKSEKRVKIRISLRRAVWYLNGEKIN